MDEIKSKEFPDMTLIKVIEEAFKVCYHVESISKNDASFESWKKKAMERVKNINQYIGGGLNYETSHPNRNKYEIPLTVAMLFKTLLSLETSKGGLGSHLNTGNLDKITHDDIRDIINTTMQYIKERYPDDEEIKQRVDTANEIMLESEDYDESKKKILNDLIDSLYNDLENIENVFEECKSAYNEYYYENFEYRWPSAVLAERHPELLTLKARESLIEHFSESLTYAFVNWKYMVSEYMEEAEKKYTNGLPDDITKDQLEELIQEAEKRAYAQTPYEVSQKKKMVIIYEDDESRKEYALNRVEAMQKFLYSYMDYLLKETHNEDNEIELPVFSENEALETVIQKEQEYLMFKDSKTQKIKILCQQQDVNRFITIK